MRNSSMRNSLNQCGWLISGVLEEALLIYRAHHCSTVSPSIHLSVEFKLIQSPLITITQHVFSIKVTVCLGESLESSGKGNSEMP